MPNRGAGRLVFQVGLIGFGAVSLVFRDFIMDVQPVPAWVPGRTLLAVISGILLIATGVGLSVPAFARTASRMLFGYLVLWVLLLEIPSVVMQPLVEVTWLNLGQVSTFALGGWFLLADGKRDPRLARILTGLALIPIGLSHFVYFQASLGFVPRWLPAPAFFSSLAGAGHLAAGLGLLFGVLPRLAAMMEAAMVMSFALLVWVPGIVAAPADRQQWTDFWVTWAVGAAAWVVADAYRGTRWWAIPGRTDAGKGNQA
jgi:uncharacterized membrane protein